MTKVKTFIYAVIAGVCIALGGTVYLSLENKTVGAALFTVGLFTICTFGFNLFTGKVCYVFQRDKKYAFDLILIWLGNLAGTYLSALLLSFTRAGGALKEKAVTVSEAKLNDTVFSVFILAIFCNILIYIAVDGYNNNPHEIGKYLALFFGVMVFILCGFEHCVANMFYFSMAGAWSLKALGYLVIMTLGNAAGGVLIPLLKMIKEK